MNVVHYRKQAANTSSPNYLHPVQSKCLTACLERIKRGHFTGTGRCLLIWLPHTKYIFVKLKVVSYMYMCKPCLAKDILLSDCHTATIRLQKHSVPSRNPGPWAQHMSHWNACMHLEGCQGAWHWCRMHRHSYVDGQNIEHENTAKGDDMFAEKGGNTGEQAAMNDCSQNLCQQKRSTTWTTVEWQYLHCKGIMS